MIRKVYFDRSNVPTNVLRTIMYFSIAEGGAMGTPGEVIAIAKSDDTIVYCGNYCYGDLKYSDVTKFFSPLKQLKPGMFGEESIAPKGWVYENLGMGNHLLIRSSIYSDFKAIVGEKKLGELYQSYMNSALSTLKNTEEEIQEYFQLN